MVKIACTGAVRVAPSSTAARSVSSMRLPARSTSQLLGKPVVSAPLTRPSINRRTAVVTKSVATDPPPSFTTLDEAIQGGYADLSSDVDSLARSMLTHFQYTVGEDPKSIGDKPQEAYRALAYTVAERLAARFKKTQDHFVEKDPKYAYYLSAEFLQGRSLLNAVENLDLDSEVRALLAKVGYSLEDMVQQETDAALGNGGLGRLAACFLDSMATLDLPMFGYGIRYTYGMFKQRIDEEGFQREGPDYWLNYGNPWEIKRPETKFPISFGGEVSKTGAWEPETTVWAVAYDNPIPGWGTENTINLRLWAAEAVEEFDLVSFNDGKYPEAVEARAQAEAISAVLYPNDDTQEGKKLRLKQQYFFTSASLQDIIARFLAAGHTNWDDLPNHACVQLNDTHPTCGVAELMRLLVDVHGVEWDQAWGITQQVFAYTNHTVLPEALEKWNADLFEPLLPRHYEIIKKIDAAFEKELIAKKVDKKVIARMKPIWEDAWGPGEDVVQMASLAMVGSKCVNGVAAVHSEIIKTTVLKDFYAVMPEKFQNKTNGVTQRRWLAFCNPELRDLITETLGSDNWIGNLNDLTALRPYAEDPEFRAKWRAIKHSCKVRLAQWVKEQTGYTISSDSLFDVQIKRIHEYKRQYLNIIRCIHTYNTILKMTPEEKAKQVPKVVMIGGKAAAGYAMAKKIIKLITAVADKVNNDPEVGDLLKVIFIPNYNVSAAEILIPGTELSEQISTAGTEASGTSNMKFAMNGALLIGTMDGANIEIWEEIGEENGFVFGATVEEVDGLLEERDEFEPCDDFTAVMDAIKEGEFGEEDSGYFDMLLDAIVGEEGAHYLPKDFYLLGRDFPSYLEAHEKVDELYKDQEEWTRRSILSAAGMGKFSTDRTIAQYAEEIWDVKACRVGSD
mmetsp:Transcript_11139/g.13156  ORF Transcript_11139/g.13156 Transcript_11139/m.13156 type:complete len:903 (-) Transcript_11139:212-2920(-)|eukprot:CAMPEP_0197843894 /NCGR_PEP_ID=MMETSP1438-20131217/863_1 /TAXON_ID=1461541 /ORGANISM="Pterosperma sp., Strain CCMP1384" /LENGTH=902 /DNA_ID=CAMNT_0043454351 /DNA_START=86 /DNA_END=2794 /DNA_ORIENTATION=-